MGRRSRTAAWSNRQRNQDPVAVSLAIPVQDGGLHPHAHALDSAMFSDGVHCNAFKRKHRAGFGRRQGLALQPPR